MSHKPFSVKCLETWREVVFAPDSVQRVAVIDSNDDDPATARRNLEVYLKDGAVENFTISQEAWIGLKNHLLN